MAGTGEDSARVTGGADLIRRISQGPVVVLARVEKVPGKAYLEVLDALRGPEDLPSRLRVAFRGANRMRKPGGRPFQVDEGEKAFFVLEPWLDSHGDWPKRDLFRPAGGYRARIPLPAEGTPALVEAVRALVAYEDDPDRSAAEGRLQGWLTGPNPYLVDVALDQAARLALAGPDWIPGLIARMTDVSPQRRQFAAKAVGLALSRGRLTPRKPGRRHLPGDAAWGELVALCRESLVRLARSDPEPEVRRVAVSHLAMSGLEVWRVLEAIAKEDPDQDVRYEAAAALLEHRRSSR